VNAWELIAEGRKDLALTMMKSAAEMKMVPTRRQLRPGRLHLRASFSARMLLEINQPTQALQQFEATLKKEPNRFRALYGAAHAAQLSGNAKQVASILPSY